MIETPGVVLERIVAAPGSRVVANAGQASRATVDATGFPVRCLAPEGISLFDFALPVARAAAEGRKIRGVVAATFSNGERFPALAVRLAATLGLPASTPAFDLQMACSAYPYALYLAGRLAADTGGDVLVVDADLQSRFVDPDDAATALVMDDAATATVVSAGAGVSRFDFLSSCDDALACPAQGPVAMDGFKVFSFVAMQVARFLKPFGTDFEMFVPHRANLYMIRRLAASLALEDKLLAPEGRFANPGSASIPLTLAAAARPGRALVAGFGAGFSAAAGLVTLADGFKGEVIS